MGKLKNFVYEKALLGSMKATLIKEDRPYSIQAGIIGGVSNLVADKLMTGVTDDDKTEISNKLKERQKSSKSITERLCIEGALLDLRSN